MNRTVTNTELEWKPVQFILFLCSPTFMKRNAYLIYLTQSLPGRNAFYLTLSRVSSLSQYNMVSCLQGGVLEKVAWAQICLCCLANSYGHSHTNEVTMILGVVKTALYPYLHVHITSMTLTNLYPRALIQYWYQLYKASLLSFYCVTFFTLVYFVKKFLITLIFLKTELLVKGL